MLGCAIGVTYCTLSRLFRLSRLSLYLGGNEVSNDATSSIVQTYLPPTYEVSYLPPTDLHPTYLRPTYLPSTYLPSTYLTYIPPTYLPPTLS